MTHDPGAPPVAATVLFLRQRAADETSDGLASAREQLLAAVQAVAEGWEQGRRVVLDATDGIAFVGDIEPLVALRAAQRVAAKLAAGAVGIALHHGPVRVAGEGIATRVLGDGVETAAALAGFTSTQSIVASRAFRDALAVNAPGAAENLRPVGEVVDERLRPHALHVFDPAAARSRALRRNLLASSGLLLLLGAGWAGRVARENYEEARRPAVIVLDVRPAGEVFVDGEPKGSAPPLMRLSLPPGPHRIEVRNGRFPPLKMDVHLQPGEEMELKHVFTAPAPPRRQRPSREPTPGEKLERTIDRYKFW